MTGGLLHATCKYDPSPAHFLISWAPPCTLHRPGLPSSHPALSQQSAQRCNRFAPQALAFLPSTTFHLPCVQALLRTPVNAPACFHSLFTPLFIPPHLVQACNALHLHRLLSAVNHARCRGDAHSSGSRGWLSRKTPPRQQGVGQGRTKAFRQHKAGRGKTTQDAAGGG